VLGTATVRFLRRLFRQHLRTCQNVVRFPRSEFAICDSQQVRFSIGFYPRFTVSGFNAVAEPACRWSLHEAEQPSVKVHALAYDDYVNFGRAVRQAPERIVLPDLFRLFCGSTLLR